MKKSFLLIALFCIGLAGCGSGSNSTNGTLTMSDITVTAGATNTYFVTGTATYTPPTGSVPNGSIIKITRYIPTTTSTPVEENKAIGTDGIASYSYVVAAGTASENITINASIGGLNLSKNSIIPAATP